MSKTNNNSRKNTKTTKNTAKKATRSRTSSKKNFKIENLEPRLMMDAAPAAFDVEKLEDYANQFANVADSIANKASEAISAVTEFDVSSLGVTQNAANFVSMLGDSADQFKSGIVDKVTEVLQNAIVAARAEIEAFNSAVENANNQIEELSLADFVNTYVKNVLQSANGTSYKGLNFSADGSKLVVSIDHTYEKSLSGLGFDFGSLGEIKMDGTSTLSTAAKLQMTVDLNSDNDEYYFEDANDINVEAPVIEKLEARIQNLGLHATFMKMGLVEENLSEETPDLSLSYNSSDVTTIVDLEFKLENSTGLPFSFAEGDYLKISNSDGNLDVHVPDFQMKGDFSLEKVLESLDFTKIPYINQLKMDFGGEKISIAQVLQNLNDVWAKTSMALSAAVSKVQSEAGQIQQQFVLNVQTLQQCLEAIAGDKWNELKGYLDGLKIDGHTIVDALNNVTNEAINLVEGENTITLFFKPKIGDLDNLNLFSLNLDGLDADFSFAVQLSVNISADGKVSFSIPSIEQFNLGVTGIQLPSGLPIALNGDELSVSLQNGELVATVPEIEVTGEFSLEAILAGLRNLDIPLLNKTLFTVGNQSYGALDIVEKVNAYWGLLSGSLYSSVVESGTVANKFMLSMEQLKNHLYDIIGQKKSELDNFIKNIEIIKTDLINTAEAQIKVFDSAVENVANLADKYIDLISGDNTITVFFSPKQLSLGTLSAGLFNLEGLDVDTPIAVDIVVTLAEGKISFKEISLREFNVNVSKSIDSSLDVGGVEINLDNGKFDFAASISGDTHSGFTFNKCGAALTYGEVSLAVAGTSLVKLDAGEFSYANGEWTLPNEFKNISSIFEGDDFDFDTIFNIALNVPYLADVKFTLPGIGECTLHDVLSKVNDFRTALPYAIAQTAEKVNGVTDVLCRIDAQALHTAFSNILTSNIDGLLETVNLKLSDMDDNSFVNILSSNVAGAFDLKKGTNTFNVVFKPIHTNLDKFSIMGIDLPDVDVNSEIGFSFSVVLDDEGVISSFDVSFDSFKFGIAINESIPEGLPFVIEGNEVSISWSGEDWEYTIPEIKWNDGFSLETVLKGLKSANIPFMDKLSFNIGTKSYKILDIAQNVNNYWGLVSGSLTSSLDSEVIANKIVLNLDMLRNKLYESMTQKKGQLDNFIKNIEIVKTELFNVAEQKINVFDSAIESAAEYGESMMNKFIELASGENKITVVFSPTQLKMNNIDLRLFNLEGVNFDTSIALDIIINLNDGEISFGGVSLHDFTLSANKSFGKKSFGFAGQKAEIEGGVFNFDVTVSGSKFAIKNSEVSFSYDKFSLKSDNTTLASLTEPGTFSYKNGEWDYPDQIKELISIWESGEFSIQAILATVNTINIPILNTNVFHIGDYDYSIGEIAKDVDYVYRNLSAALYDAVESVGNNIQLTLNNLKTKFEEYVGDKLDGVNHLLSCVEVINESVPSLEIDDYNILGTVEKAIGLTTGSNTIKFVLNTKNVEYNDIKIGAFDIGTIRAALIFEIELTFNVDSDGKISNIQTQMGELAVDVDASSASGLSVLPIDVGPDKHFKIGYDIGKGEWICPDIQVQSLDNVIENLISTLDLTKIPYIGSLDFTIAGKTFNISSILQSAKDVWFNTSKALNGTIAQIDSNNFQLDFDQLKSLFDNFCNEKKSEMEAWLGNLKVVSGGIDLYDTLSNAYEMWENNKDVGKNALLKGREFTFVYSLQPANLSEFTLYSYSLGKLGFGMDIAIKVSVEDDGGSIKCTPSLEGIALTVDVASNIIDNLPITFDDSQIRISYVNGEWNVKIPDFHLKEDALSIENILSTIDSLEIPFLKNTTFKLAGETVTLSEVVSKVNNIWSGIALAMNSAEESGELNLETLKSSFEKIVDETIGDNVSNKLQSLQDILGDIRVNDATLAIENYFSLLNDNSSLDAAYKKIGLTEGSEKTLTFVFSPEIELGNLNLGSMQLNNLKMPITLAIDVTLKLNNGKIELEKVGFNKFSIGLDDNGSSFADLEISDKASAKVSGIDFDCNFEIGKKDEDGSLVFKPEQSKLNIGYDSIVVNVLDAHFTLGKDVIGYDFSENKPICPKFIDNLFGENSFSLQTILSFAESANIPIIGDKKIMIDSGRYSIIELAQHVDKLRTNFSIALDELVESIEDKTEGIKIKFTELCDKFKETFGNQFEELKSLFDGVKVQYGMYTLDLLSETVSYFDDANGQTVIDENNALNLLSISSTIDFKFDFVFKQASGNVEFYGTSFSITPTVKVGLNLHVDYSDDRLSVNPEFESFVIAVQEITNRATSALPYYVAQNGVDGENTCLEIGVSKNTQSGEYEFTYNIEENPTFSIEGLLDKLKEIKISNLLKSIENVTIPGLNKSLSEITFKLSSTEYTIPSVVKTIEDYWILVSDAANRTCEKLADESMNIRISDLANSLSTNANMVSAKILDSINVTHDSLSSVVDILKSSSASDFIHLPKNDSTDICFEFVPQKMTFENLNLGLFKLDTLDLDLSLKIKLTLKLNDEGVLEDPTISIESLKFDLKTDVPDAKLGMFNADFTDAEFSFSAELDGSGIKNKNVELTYGEIELKTGGVTLVKLENDTDDKKEQNKFALNLDTNEWTLPEDIKCFTSLSGDSLVNQIHVVLNTMQTALRSLVEKKTKLDFLDSSIDKIVDIVDKVETFVYGNNEDGAEKVEGLLKCINGKYTFNFESLNDLINRFNISWKHVFKLYSNAEKAAGKWLDNDFNVAIDATSDQQIFDIKYYDSLGKEVDASSQNGTGVASCKLVFDLLFSIEKEFGLNFATTLAEKTKDFANVSTSGYVTASGSAGMKFELNIKFEKQSLTDQMTLKDVVGDDDSDEYLIQQSYTEFGISDKICFDDKLTIKLVNPKDSLDEFSYLINAGDELDSTYVNNLNRNNSHNYNLSFTSANQLCITANQEFDIKGSEDADGFAELKLSGTNLQTAYTKNNISVSNGTIEIKLLSAKLNSEGVVEKGNTSVDFKIKNQMVIRLL